jgi:hypothetical protein
MLLSHDSSINEQLLHLPPSLKAGDSIGDRSGRTYMQPLISYAIHAVVEFHGLATGPSVKAQTAREIMLIPFTEISPPMATEDFPGEYTSISTKSLTKMPFGRLFGEMCISMNEPSALRFNDGSPSANTLAYLRLVWRPVDAATNHIGPRRLTCTIRSGIVVKEIYSTIPLREVPSYAMLKTEKCVRARSSYIDLQTRKMEADSWIFEGQPQPGRNGKSRGSAWATTLILPICGPKRLLPTFCSALAALRYVLRVHLDIRGIYHSPFTLEVPLQVLYCRDVGSARVGSGVADRYYVSGTLQVGYADSMTSSRVTKAS